VPKAYGLSIVENLKCLLLSVSYFSIYRSRSLKVATNKFWPKVGYA
jgi:hypothetical protein